MTNETNGNSTPSGENPAGDTPSGDTPSGNTPSGDIVEQQIAQVYAQALLDAAAAEDGKETDGEAAILAEFDSLMADVLDTNPQFETVIGSALINADEKIEILDRVFSGRASTRMLSFLKVLAEHERLDCLRTIHSEAVDLHNRRCGKIPVDVVLAAATDEGLIDRIRSELRRGLKAEPLVNTRIDPSLIAGFSIRVGDRVYDGSVKTYFHHIREVMIRRSIDMIQTQRERLVESD